MYKSSAKHITKYFGIIIVLVLVFIVWNGFAKFMNKPFLPSPSITVKTLMSLAQSGILFFHLRASLSRIFFAIIFSFIPAVALGLAAGRSAKLNAIISPLLYIMHPLPKAAFLPLIMLFLGIGEISKIFLLVFIVFSQILIAARDSSKRISQNIIDSVRSMGAKRFQIVLHAIIPATLPDLFTSLRVSLGTLIAVLFLAETFASSSGLGFLIIDAWTRIAYPEMYAAILALSFLGLVLFAVTDICEKICCPWK
jgi:NitT/TauT family transport system permease protein